jgi:hypothetical protein
MQKPRPAKCVQIVPIDDGFLFLLSNGSVYQCANGKWLKVDLPWQKSGTANANATAEPNPPEAKQE